MTEKIERMELEAESKDKVYFVINCTPIFIMIIDSWLLKQWLAICV